jgi:hypothetical protein
MGGKWGGGGGDVCVYVFFFFFKEIKNFNENFCDLFQQSSKTS